MTPKKPWAGHAFLLIPLLAVYGCFAALPVATVINLSLHNGLASFQKMFGSTIFYRTLENTIVISAQTTLISVIVGYLLAALIWRASGKARMVLLAFVLLPFWTAVLIKNFAWAVLLQDNGPINTYLMSLGLINAPLHLLHNRFAVVTGMVHYLIPYAVFPIFSVMQSIDTRVERAAYSLGASRLSTFCLVTLPLTRPGIYAATLLVFIISLSFYITPVVLGSPREQMVANLVEFYAHELVDFSTAATLSVLILAAAAFLIVAYQRLPKEGQHGNA